MVTVKILKRKDASSVIVAVVIALIILQTLQGVTLRWSNWLSGLNYGQPTNGSGWKQEYLQPVVTAILQLLVLEVILWVCVWAGALMKKK
jgi:hypothetical protein